MCGECIEVKNNLSACTRRAFSGLNTFKRNNKTRLKSLEGKESSVIFFFSFLWGCVE